MINLKTFFKNHFDTKDISDNNLKVFTEVHLQLVAANNPGGIYSARITAVTNAYTNYFGAISNEDIKLALQQGLTVTMNATVKDFIKTTQQKEGIIRGTWGLDSEEYQEFFPYGLTEYTNATLATVELLMNRMVAASTNHMADLGAPFVTLFTDLRTDYTTARTAQLAVMGEVQGLNTTAENTRNTLEVELMTNLLTIASNNVGQTNMLSDYFDQSIIRSAGTPDEELLDEFTLPGNQVVYNVDLDELVVTATTKFRIINKAEGAAAHLAVGYFTTNATQAPGDPPIGKVVNPGDNRLFTAVDLGWSGVNTFLNFMAPGADPIDIEVWVVE